MLVSFKEYLNHGLIASHKGTGIYVNPSSTEMLQLIKKKIEVSFTTDSRENVFIYDSFLDWDTVREVLIKQGKLDVAIPILGHGSIRLDDDGQNNDVDVYVNSDKHCYNNKGLQFALRGNFHVHYE